LERIFRSPLLGFFFFSSPLPRAGVLDSVLSGWDFFLRPGRVFFFFQGPWNVFWKGLVRFLCPPFSGSPFPEAGVFFFSFGKKVFPKIPGPPPPPPPFLVLVTNFHPRFLEKGQAPPTTCHCAPFERILIPFLGFWGVKEASGTFGPTGSENLFVRFIK